MFRNKFNKLDKEILKDANYFSENENQIIIDVKIDNHNQLYSSFNYDNNESLNNEFCDYIWNNSKLAPINKDVTINIYDNTNNDKTQIESAIKNHYRREYKQAKLNLNKINIFTLGCMIAGVLCLLLLVFFHNAINNYYIDIILEVASWVFIWEAVDKFFIERPKQKRLCLQIQNLYFAKITIQR